jgi:hypothetical protein
MTQLAYHAEYPSKVSFVTSIPIGAYIQPCPELLYLPLTTPTARSASPRLSFQTSPVRSIHNHSWLMSPTSFLRKIWPFKSTFPYTPQKWTFMLINLVISHMIELESLKTITSNILQLQLKYRIHTSNMYEGIKRKPSLKSRTLSYFLP